MEIIAFRAEEPSPFGLSTIGSRAMAGKLSTEDLIAYQDPDGRALAQAITAMGREAENIDKAGRVKGDVHACLELHIEQGPYFEKESINLGIVTGIVGIHRGTITITGKNDHSGTNTDGFQERCFNCGFRNYSGF